MEGDQLPTGKLRKSVAPILLQGFQPGKQVIQIGGENRFPLGVTIGQTGADVGGHDFGIGGGEPDVGIILVMVLVLVGLMGVVLSVIMSVVVVGFPFQQGNSLRGIHRGLPGEDVLHKFLQPCTGENDEIGALCLTDLVHVQGVVMQAGDGL